jgi:hypothetical protein
MKALAKYWESLNGERAIIGVVTFFSTVGLSLMSWMLTTIWDMNSNLNRISSTIEQTVRLDIEQSQSLTRHDIQIMDHEKRLIIIEQRHLNSTSNTNRPR